MTTKCYYFAVCTFSMENAQKTRNHIISKNENSCFNLFKNKNQELLFCEF